MKSTGLLLTGVLALLSLAACGSPAQPEATPTAVPEGIGAYLITQQPCAPPCWEGIIPGETDGEEAQAILQGLAYIDPASIEVVPSMTRQGGQVINWQSAQDERRVGSVALEPDGSVLYVSTINAYQPTLNQMLTIYGDPDYYYMRDSAGTLPTTIELVWFEAGIVAYVELAPGAFLGPGVAVRSATLFEPVSSLSGYADRAGIPPAGVERYRPWQGYLDVQAPDSPS